MRQPRLQPQEQLQRQPVIPIAPLIDIVFLILIFFMTLSIYYQAENELSISIPKAEKSTESVRSPGEIIINVDKEGEIIVNQRHFQLPELAQMLMRVASLYPNQPVIIRADKLTHHEDVVEVLDACAAANIWNIAFATLKE